MAALTVALLLSLNVILVSNACDCQSYRAPLLALYNSTGGPHWQNPWDLNLEVCDWFGISCFGFGSININLTQQLLTGTLPGSTFTDYFGGGLERLILSSNNLTGTIPPQYGNITRLWNFDVGNNSLTGTLPPELSKWTHTQMNLRFTKNKLSGTLPPEYAAMDMQTLFFDDNDFTGTLPPEYGRWNNVMSFTVPRNSLTGTLPPSYGNFTVLKLIDISFNRISGSIPLEYQNWLQLQFLRFQGNFLSGTLWPQFGTAWSNVTILHLFSNRLSGQIPLSWGEMSRVEALTFISNNFTGSLPPTFSKLSAVRVLSFDNNQITGTLPDAWSALRLVVLGLQGNPRLTGAVPQSWSAMYRSTTSPLNVVSVCDTAICNGATSSAATILRPARLSCIPSNALDKVDSDITSVVIETYTQPEAIVPDCFPTTPTPANISTFAPTPPYRSYSTTAANRASTTVGVMLWTSVAASSVFPGLSAGTPSMGAMQSAIGALKLRIRCYYESNNNNNGGSSSGDSSGSSPGTVEGIVDIGGEIQDNPTQLTLRGLDNDDASTVFALAGGTIVGNMIVMVVHAVILRLFAGELIPRALDWVRDDHSDARRSVAGKGSSPPSVIRSGVTVALEWMHLDPRKAKFPGTLAGTYALMLQPSVTASIVLLGGGGPRATSGAVALGGIGIVVWSSLLLWFMWRLELHYRWKLWRKDDLDEFPCEAVPVVPPRFRLREKTKVATSKMSKVTELLWRFLVSPHKEYRWTAIDSSVKAEASSLLAAYGPLFAESSKGWRLFFMVDMGTTFISSVVVGVSSVSVGSPCSAAIWGGSILAAISVVQCGVFVFYRPLSRRADNVAAGLVTGLAMIAKILAAAASDDGATSAALAMAAGVVQLIFFVVSLASTIRFRHDLDAQALGAQQAAPVIIGNLNNNDINATGANKRSTNLRSKKYQPLLSTTTLNSSELETKTYEYNSTKKQQYRSSSKDELARLVRLICDTRTSKLQGTEMTR